jgi:mRNA-degrading endonuclease RelE of RelBE toxin-antitoxin system
MGGITNMIMDLENPYSAGMSKEERCKSVYKLEALYILYAWCADDDVSDECFITHEDKENLEIKTNLKMNERNRMSRFKRNVLDMSFEDFAGKFNCVGGGNYFEGRIKGGFLVMCNFNSDEKIVILIRPNT